MDENDDYLCSSNIMIYKSSAIYVATDTHHFNRYLIDEVGNNNTIDNDNTSQNKKMKSSRIDNNKQILSIFHITDYNHPSYSK